MGYTVNRIPESASNFSNGVSSVHWTGNAYPSGLPFSREVERYPNVGSIAVSTDIGHVIEYNYNILTDGPATNDSNTTIDDRGYLIEAFFWVKVSSPIHLDVSLHLYHNGLGNPIPPIDGGITDVYIDSGDWVLVRTNPVVVPVDIHDFGCVLRIETTDVTVSLSPVTYDMYISYPCIYNQLDFVNNPAIEDIASFIPGCIKRTIPDGVNPTYTLGRFIEVLISEYGGIFDNVESFAYADVSEGFSEQNALSKSTLVNPDVVLRAYTDWLAQFTGTRVAISSVSSTPWGSIEGTWQEIDALDTVVDPDDSVAWAAAELYSPVPIGIEEFIRWQLKYGYYGYNAGSLESIEQSVKRVLSGTKFVNVVTFPPFVVTVFTYSNETPGTTSSTYTGESILEIQQILDEIRPLGTIVTHSVMIAP